MLCTTRLPSDVVVDVDDTTFHLHKIPRNSVCIARSFAASSVGLLLLEEFLYKRGDWIVFWSETTGLTPVALHDFKTEPLGGGTLKILIVETYVRCLNLSVSVSVGIGLYGASRQLKYEQLQSYTEPCNGNIADGR
ncbi:hypothetical protein L1987_37173 [Smallanthus sonchifolius]|uniref:Uncharacterized protein n=1 Tax=Smallanthus sonchifolius TaxID=185202 RepID=A0ACB9HGB0_9ASTR|nr:hypothetical protein L1987_37173 [Smallanthus sonchifolius]